jgi:hypothetical protein
MRARLGVSSQRTSGAAAGTQLWLHSGVNGAALYRDPIFLNPAAVAVAYASGQDQMNLVPRYAGINWRAIIPAGTSFDVTLSVYGYTLHDW